MTHSSPPRCFACAAGQLIPASVRYETTARIDRVEYPVAIQNLPILRCSACGEEYFGDDADRAIGRAVRKAAGLLHAESIRAMRRELGMSQKQFARLLGVAAPALNRWEKGHVVQSRLVDTLLRVVAALPEARELLLAMGNIARRPPEVPVIRRSGRAFGGANDCVRLAATPGYSTSGDGYRTSSLERNANLSDNLAA